MTAHRLSFDLELRRDRSVTGPMRGKVLARTVRLPARIELTGDTTILADEVVLTGGGLTVTHAGTR